MNKKLFVGMLALLSVIAGNSPARAQIRFTDGVHTVVPSYISRQSNGLLTVATMDTWMDGNEMNVLFFNFNNLNCQNLSAKLYLIQGNLGVNVIYRPQSQQVIFGKGNLHDQVIWSICKKRP